MCSGKSTSWGAEAPQTGTRCVEQLGQEEGVEEGHTAKRSKYGPAPGTSYAKLDSQPDLWEEDLPEADPKLEAQLCKLSRKVRAQGGRVVHSTQLWRTACQRVVQLHQSCSVQRWDTHTSKEKHTSALTLSNSLIVLGNHNWLTLRKAQWRELKHIKALNRMYG